MIKVETHGEEFDFNYDGTREDLLCEIIEINGALLSGLSKNNADYRFLLSYIAQELEVQMNLFMDTYKDCGAVYYDDEEVDE